MTDFDADEPVAPLAVRKKRFWTADRVIGWSGAGLALMAAFFPWYVFINEDQFGLATLRRLVTGTPAIPSRDVALSDATRPVTGRERFAALQRSEDDLVTGAVKAKPDDAGGEAVPVPDQPFPTAPRNFRLLKVIKDQAMIEDATGIFVVRKGDVLPDRTKVATLEQRDGKWVLVTDAGAAFAAVED